MGDLFDQELSSLAFLELPNRYFHRHAPPEYHLQIDCLAGVALHRTASIPGIQSNFGGNSQCHSRSFRKLRTTGTWLFVATQAPRLSSGRAATDAVSAAGE